MTRNIKKCFTQYRSTQGPASVSVRWSAISIFRNLVGQKRQADSPPQLMSSQSRQRYPDMAIDKLCSVRADSGVAMDTCAGNFGAVSFCRAVINSHKNPVLFFVNELYHNFKQYCCDYFSFLSYRADKIVECFVTFGNIGCPKPACYGFSAVKELN